MWYGIVRNLSVWMRMLMMILMLVMVLAMMVVAVMRWWRKVWTEVSLRMLQLIGRLRMGTIVDVVAVVMMKVRNVPVLLLLLLLLVVVVLLLIVVVVLLVLLLLLGVELMIEMVRPLLVVSNHFLILVVMVGTVISVVHSVFQVLNCCLCR